MFEKDLFAPDAPLFDPKDFETLDIRIHLYRANSAPTKSSRSGMQFELLEIEDDVLVVDVPARFCSTGHHLMLVLDVGQNTRFMATVKVVSIESSDGPRERHRVSMVQYDKKTWSEIRQILSRRQSEISEFMSAAKGH
jgi:hypothetical protein